jgi:outer membrane protein
MKNLSLVLNGVLLVAVVVLFVLHFSSREPEAEKTVQDAAGTVSQDNTGELNVAYVYIDSLLAHYKMAQDMSEQLFSRKDNLERELSTKGQSLEKKITDYQYKVQKGLITSWDAKEEEKKLAEEQQVFINLQNDMQNKLLTEEQQANEKVHNSVVKAVREYNEDKGYRLIFSHAYGGVLLYAEDHMNITGDILKKLNAEYENSK